VSSRVEQVTSMGGGKELREKGLSIDLEGAPATECLSEQTMREWGSLEESGHEAVTWG
jgi:hypothetical protein